MAARRTAAPEAGTGLSSLDDFVYPFRAEATGVMGKLVRLGGAVDTVLGRHDYPEPVSKVLGEALALTAMLGVALKPESRLTLQTRSDGPMGFLVVNFQAPGLLRGYASFDADRLAEAGTATSASSTSALLLGEGHLAMTIDPGGEANSYQGIVALSGEPLQDVALTYFKQSEQLPTFIRLAVARQYRREGPDGNPGWRWRAGGLLLQHPEHEADRLSGRDRLKGDGTGWDLDDGWERTRILAATVEDHELLDPTLAPDRLLLRLFHEEGVRVFTPRPISVHCTCSKERLGKLLKQFPAADLGEMVTADGAIEARCEYCNSTYRFGLEEVT